MDLLGDLRYALRLLRKTPVFTIAALGTLALGIGANTTIFSLVQTMLLRPLPYQNPDQVVMVWEDRTAAGFPRSAPAPGNYQDWRTMNRSFTDMAATAFAFANITGDGAPEIVLGRRVTANFFSVLGVQPVLGRAFTAVGRHQRSARRGDQPCALAAPLRRRSRHRRPHDLDERGARRRRQARGGWCGPTVVRVHLNREIDYWVPMQFSPEEATTRGNHFLEVVARLKPGVTVEAADSDMRAIAKRLSEQYPQSNRDLGAVVVPIREQVLGNTRVQVIALMTAAAAIVLIACANLASLLLARASVRRGEYAVRLSLGASRGRLARQVLVEALCLSIAGGVLGLAIPVLTDDVRRADRACRPAVVRCVAHGLASARVCRRALDRDRRVVQPRAGAAIGARVHRGRAAAARARQRRRTEPRVPRRTGRPAGGGHAGAARRRRTDAANARQPQRRRPRVRREQPVDDAGAADAEVRGPDHAAAVLRARRSPASAHCQVCEGQHLAQRFHSSPRVSRGPSVSRDVSALPGDQPDALVRVGTADYLQTLRLTLVEGRLLDARDGADAPLAVVVNETLTRQFMAGQSALGRQIRFNPTSQRSRYSPSSAS